MTKLIAKIAVIAVLGGSVSGCVQVTKVADGVWGGTKSVAKFVSSPVRGLLRGPQDADYDFEASEHAASDMDVLIYGQDDSYVSPEFTTTTYADNSASTANYAGYDVELYNMPDLRSAPAQSYSTPMTDPRSAAFINLNGQTQQSDWRNCETMHKGYLFADEGEFRLNPKFEVCMRNKGYVMESEANQFGSYGGEAVRAPSPYVAGGLISYP